MLFKFSHSIMSSSSLLLIFMTMLLFVCFPSCTMPKKTALPFTKTNQNLELQTYIVHLEFPSDDDRTFSGREDVIRWYNSFLPDSSESSKTGLSSSSRMVHTYHNVFTGFAANLSPKEVKSMKKMSGFLSARPHRLLSMHTTHSPNFLGLHTDGGTWPDSNYGKNVIIGVVDSGITPTHPSFNDTGMPPPPAKWKGKCELNGTTCNNKLIGARSFIAGASAVDDFGHGTHIASIAAGNFVDRASLFGQANGTAAGMAPMAHVAVYRACDYLCPDSAILAAMDAAVEDGVDILSLSIGDGISLSFESDVIAIGAFGAMNKGILVSCSAGNSGPRPGTLSNEAPWILTVGASTMDRTIKATAVLGNNESYDGQSLNQSSNFLLPLVYSNETALCESFEGVDVDIRGKLVLCDNPAYGGMKGQIVKNAGGAAMILVNTEFQGDTTLTDPLPLPAMQVSHQTGDRIKRYISSTKNPTASIRFGGTVIGDNSPSAPTPVVAVFSSRGPNLASPGILKPDVIGPGTNILAAWDESVDGITLFQMQSGTSISGPHLSGIAALIKSFHPDWSPAAIKSAIMTTAYQLNHAKKPILDEQLKPANLFSIGAGHVDPSKALDPGLIYDMEPDDYIAYLCGLGYNDTQVYAVTNSRVKCSKIGAISEAELNYPSFAVKLGRVNQTYSRTVTNVGPANSSYACSVISPEGVDVICSPRVLHFSEVNQKMKYQVTFSLSDLPCAGYFDGSLTWTSTTSKHAVRMPISVLVE